MYSIVHNKWHKCDENIYHPEGDNYVIAYPNGDGGWDYWTSRECPYGWNVLCRNNAYIMLLSEPDSM